ncbi:hypothetical protein NDU88_004368 [Pleurodeles waltl]|uniref:Uncharacterized protein n=1 Tax=Pleurodeles waltl TaxID=8319 RepID=A0AAV7PCR5_PLEWA|nr:hypothetical protein NDU88_004368 [Pleurodeles waltl]
MPHAWILDCFCRAAALLGRSAARPAVLRQAADCAAGRTVRRIARVVAARALQGWPLPCLVLTDTSGGSGGAALGSWLFLMATKAARMPQTLRAKANLVPIAGRKEKTQVAPLPGDQTNARGKGGQQSAFAMEKAARNAQVPAIFTQTLKSKRTPPQKEVPNAQSGIPGSNGDQVLVAGTGARGTASLEKTGMLLNTGKEGAPLCSDVNMSDGAKEVVLGETSSNAGICNAT